MFKLSVAKRRHLFSAVLLLMFANATKISSSETCPQGCRCEEPTTLICTDLEIQRIPPDWPSGFQKIFLRNCSLNTIPKNAFRKFHALEELRIDKCPNLDLIDKFAFKGLPKLRVLTITNNPKLIHIYKATFSGIGNEESLKIILRNNHLEKLHSMAFKNVHNLRELTIEDRCIKIATHAFSTISKVDFLTLKGVCSFEEQTFANVSRIHQLHIFDSSANLVKNTFVKLSHINQILIHESGIEKIEEGAFNELFTTGSLQIQSNRIGRVDPRAFVGTENLGTLIFSYNTLRDPLETPECLLNDAHKFVFTENTLHCSCPMRWVEHYNDQTVLNENYCGKEEAFKSLAFFQPRFCISLETTTIEPNFVTEIIAQPDSTYRRQSYPASNTQTLSPPIWIVVCVCLISIQFTFLMNRIYYLDCLISLSNFKF